jgi:hypothetical protein
VVGRGEQAERAAHQAALPHLRVQRVRVSLRRREHHPGDRIAAPLQQPQRGGLDDAALDSLSEAHPALLRRAAGPVVSGHAIIS